MRHSMGPEGKVLYVKGKSPVHALQQRADEVLVATAVLGLLASVADGDAHQREIRQFSTSFRRRFLLSNTKALQLIGVALRRIRTESADTMIADACDSLNVHLDAQQRMRVFDDLAEILIADGKVHSGEEIFLEYVAGKLHLVPALKHRFGEAVS
jgi:uncharacterized tellurite resistance protein B-like protein